MILVLFYYTNQEGFVDAVSGTAAGTAAATGTAAVIPELVSTTDGRRCVSRNATAAEPTFLCQAKEYLSSLIPGLNNGYRYKCCSVKDGGPGDQGERGPQGPQGDSPKGLTGPIGDTGPQGLTGNIGPAGYNGAAGLTGSQGTGEVGSTMEIKGPQGPQGLTGPDGDIGPTGLQGINGLSEDSTNMPVEQNDRLTNEAERTLHLRSIQKRIQNILKSKDTLSNDTMTTPSIAQGREYRTSYSV